MNVQVAARMRLPQQGTIRAAPLTAVPAVMQELGADLAPIMAALGLPQRVFEDPDESIAYQTVCNLMAACCRAAACAHFGLLVVQHVGITPLGALGYLMQNAPAVCTGIDTLINHMDVRVRGSAPPLD